MSEQPDAEAAAIAAIRRMNELEKGIRYWCYCLWRGMERECPEKKPELLEFLGGLGINPYKDEFLSKAKAALVMDDLDAARAEIAQLEGHKADWRRMTEDAQAIAAEAIKQRDDARQVARELLTMTTALDNTVASVSRLATLVAAHPWLAG